MMYNGESSRQSELTHSPRRHRRSQSGNHSSCIPSVLPTTSSTLFEDEPLKLSIGNSTKDFSGECSERFKGHGKGSSPLLPLLSPHRRISMSSMGFCKPRQPLRTSAVRLAAMLVSLCAAIPLLYSSSRSTTDSKKITNVPRTSLRKPTSGPAAAIVRSTLEMVTPDIAIADNVKAIELDDSNPVKETVAQERCESRKRWHEPSASTPSAGLRVERAQCAPLLPTSVLENEGWLVGVHIDRAPTTQATNLRLRGAAAVPPTHRSLPHEYFVRVMGAALEGISRVEPAASVDVVVVSEGMWGGLIDSTGLPMEWDIPLGMCKGLGLSCTQTNVLVSNRATVTDALECIAAADVMISSEDEFSKAAAALSGNVKILTDQWDIDADEEMVIVDPLVIMAGTAMPLADRAEFCRVIREYRECSML